MRLCSRPKATPNEKRDSVVKKAARNGVGSNNWDNAPVPSKKPGRVIVTHRMELLPIREVCEPDAVASHVHRGAVRDLLQVVIRLPVLRVDWLTTNAIQRSDNVHFVRVRKEVGLVKTRGKIEKGGQCANRCHRVIGHTQSWRPAAFGLSLGG